MNILLIVPLGYLAICLVIYLKQDSMVFVPTKESVEGQIARAAAGKFSPWLTASGERIGWFSESGDPQNVMLIFNGNGGYALGRMYYREYCQSAGNWRTFLLEYPGYGAREGSPSEKTIVDAAISALDTLAEPGRKIWLLGESLGSGVACAVAAARPDQVAGIVLVTPYSSLVDAASFHYPWLPVSLLLRTRLDSVSHLKKYSGPIIFVVGDHDITVPTVLGKKLFESYAGPKKFWLAPDADHDVSGFLQTGWSGIVGFLQKGG